ncbi:MAG: Efflux ABC transporter, permease/ATP-binding protein mlr7818 [uncultured Sphingomonadaceae bacterium]|uniref:Efflux ABC transporter, permease/ATP-binding protein mlr7818 n=1 Tax=uncultured Sphingomonadaceae bacterium TaxID=169976 RepID=A0A6J4SZV7_9SPHN|nr:MAG: Efflux ABC transporter, permease/ATP-binding protein mlr7818 [uncultured Sphingomonadaceae bacterium]
MRRFLPYLWPADAPGLRLRVAGSFGLVLLSISLTSLVMPLAFGAVVDRLAAGREAEVAVAIALVAAYVGARFGGVLLDNLRNALFEAVGQDATRRLAEHVFGHLHGLSLRFHLARRTGAVTKVIERGSKSIDTMLYFLLFNIAPTFVQLGIVGVLFWTKFGWELVAVTAFMVVGYVWYTKVMTEWRTRLREQWAEHDTAATARAVDSLLNFETVKYFNAEARERRSYAAAVAALSRTTVKVESSLAWLNVGQSLITNLMMAGAMAYAVWGWSQGRVSVGDVVVVNTLLAQLFRPLDLLGMVYRTIRQGLTDMAAMFDLIDTPAEVTDRPGAPDLRVSRGHVRFEDVRFGYEPDREILHGVDLDVPAGTTLAVVGPSGAGKSTLSRLLFRFYDPTAGRITIDGRDIREVTQDSLRRAIGIVPQDSVLFNDTIGYNIAYGRDGAEPAEVAAAARGASIDGLIEALPDGYDARVGERGLKLSGGEKQRVAIARTLLKNPPILILDEATSALDSRTEAAIQDTLRELSAQRTTITIAHRLSTVVDADQIVVLDGGRVAERGRHAELLRRGGLYAEMWARQQAEREEEPVAAAAE